MSSPGLKGATVLTGDNLPFVPTLWGCLFDTPTCELPHLSPIHNAYYCYY